MQNSQNPITILNTNGNLYLKLKMKRNWTKKNVELALLTTRTGDFFKEKDFEAIRGKIPTGYQILAEDSPHFKIHGYASVTIEGKPQDFTVKLEHCGNNKKRSWVSPFLLNMLGGGYFFLQQLKSKEAWIKLEKEFWRHVENVVLQLTNSAELSTGLSE